MQEDKIKSVNEGQININQENKQNQLFKELKDNALKMQFSDFDTVQNTYQNFFSSRDKSKQRNLDGYKQSIQSLKSQNYLNIIAPIKLPVSSSQSHRSIKNNFGGIQSERGSFFKETAVRSRQVFANKQNTDELNSQNGQLNVSQCQNFKNKSERALFLKKSQDIPQFLYPNESLCKVSQNRHDLLTFKLNSVKTKSHQNDLEVQLLVVMNRMRSASQNFDDSHESPSKILQQLTDCIFDAFDLILQTQDLLFKDYLSTIRDLIKLIIYKHKKDLPEFLKDQIYEADIQFSQEYKKIPFFEIYEKTLQELSKTVKEL